MKKKKLNFGKNQSVKKWKLLETKRGEMMVTEKRRGLGIS